MHWGIKLEKKTTETESEDTDLWRKQSQAIAVEKGLQQGEHQWLNL